MKRLIAGIVSVAFAVTMLSGTAIAQVTPPAGLAPGSEYQIMFVTADATSGTSTNISAYNTFVTEEAEQSTSLPTGVTWSAVASTPTTNAIDNAPTYASVPIYNTAGQLVATGSSLWSGSILAPVGYNQYGTTGPEIVWTGTIPEGSVSGDPLGVFTEYPNTVWGIPSFGFSVDSTYEWVFTGTTSWQSTQPENPALVLSYPLYALSSPITVPVPEPSTLMLLLTGGAGLFAYVWRKRRR